MSEPRIEPIEFISTKLLKPRLSGSNIARPHLLKLLDQGVDHRLTLVCAPAGYGKTTLLCTWLQARSSTCAWVTLDTNDNDLVTFVSYIIAAIRTQAPTACSNTKALLNALQLPPAERLSNSLVNEISKLPDSICLVLDDYHEIRDNDIHQLVLGLIRYPLPQLSLVIASRYDPAFSLSRLRGAQKLTEIRVNDLRFTDEEAQKYLQQVLDAAVDKKLAARLVERTEGWPVGLRLAALGMREHDDPTAFVEGFHGDHRYITSYLVDEVFAHQPQTVQTFLLYTSILDRFCAGLCDAVMRNGALAAADESGSPASVKSERSSQEILALLEKSNLFVTPLDQQGEWFRYHQLFQDLLFHRLLSETTPADRAALHNAAGSWLEQNGFVEEAIRHSIAASDYIGAADLVGRNRYSLMNRTQWQRLERWLRSFPPEWVNKHPDLLILKAWLVHRYGNYAELPSALNRIEAAIERSQLTPESLRRLRGESSALQSLVEYYALKPELAIKHARQSISDTVPELWIARVLARLVLAGALQMRGKLENAYGTIFRGLEEEEVSSSHFKAIVLSTICHVYWIAADLQGLSQTAEKSLALSGDQRMPEFEGWGHYHLACARYHQNDLAAAERHFAAVVREPYLNYGLCYLQSACGLALTYHSQGRVEEARGTAVSALDFMLETGNTTLLTVAQSLQVELMLREGRIAAAGQWANRFDSLPTLLPQVDFYSPQLTLVKAWLVQGSMASRQRAKALLGRMQVFVERTHNTRVLIEVLALWALRHAEKRKMADARFALGQAVDLAQPSGYIRLFVDLGPRMAELMAELPSGVGYRRAYVDQILDAFTRQNSPPRPADVMPIFDPLTEREMDVLALLAQRRSNKEIAETLYISLNTVSTHASNLFAKLEVHNRRQAVARARELGLLASE